MTHTKEEVIEKAIEYFLPLANKNDENFFLREGEIFLNWQKKNEQYLLKYKSSNILNILLYLPHY